MRIRLLSTLPLTLVVWALFTRPLTPIAEKAIACSASNYHAAPLRVMVPGDHLQLLHRFWLLGDVLRGNGQWETNDAERHQAGACYVPLTMIYAAGAVISL